MCGITGFFNNKLDFIDEICTRMLKPIHHRGPDDYGVWADSCGIALGHKRLSILDLSPLGHQPMHSHSDRYVIVFNGEIYNFAQIKDELVPAGYSFDFKGHSDTEIMLAAIEQWGLKKAVEKFVGMFAFALWDKKERTLSLVRDRMGIKPLYYGFQKCSFIFGSELTVFKEHPDFLNEINRDNLNLFFRYGYIPAPHSIYENIYKLAPGTILTLNYEDLMTQNLPQPSPYWSIQDVYKYGANNQFTGSFDEAVTELENLLKKSISLRMIADVPLGAFLSGGVDSSLIVALMQSMSDRKVKTFSIGFNEEDYNEAKYAKAVANHLGTEHTEFYLNQKDLLNFIPQLNKHIDEPFGDSSIVPTYFVSKLAREHVTVSLTGDGGDEVFSGYLKYTGAVRGWNNISKYDIRFRKMISLLIQQFSSKSLDKLGKPFEWALGSFFGGDSLGTRLYKLSEIFSDKDFVSFYKDCNSLYKNNTSLVLNTNPPPSNHILDIQGLDEYQYMSMVDISSYMVDDILTKVDRASMAVSLESRIPILDHRIVEFSTTLPTEMKVNNGNCKHILKELLYKYVPRELIDRPKKGFSMPIGLWLKDDLKDMFEDLIQPEKLKNQGYLDSKCVNKLWTEHLSGRRNWEHVLWNVFIFQKWMQDNKL